MGGSHINDQNGLTLIELIVVLAIIVIIGAILIPNFLVTTDRARLKSDIQSAKVLQSAVTLYHAEQGDSLDSKDIDTILEILYDSGYVKKTDKMDTQTAGAVWAYEPISPGGDKNILVDITTGVDSRIKTEIYQNLSEEEQKWVKGGINK